MRPIFLSSGLLTTLLAISPLVAACFASAPSLDDEGDCSGQLIDIVGLAYWVIVGDTPDDAWGYLETNGVPGLQRGGCYHGIWDTCQTTHPAGPDFLFY